MTDNKPKTSQHQAPRYWVEDDEMGKLYMDGPHVLRFLGDNDPVHCGCDWMTDEEWDAEVLKPEDVAE